MSILLTLDSSTLPANTTTHDFIVQYNPPLQLRDNDKQDVSYEVALVRANLWYSYYNIRASFSNNQVRYYNGTSWTTVTIPDGSYDIFQLNNYLHAVMKDNGDYTVVSGVDTYDIILSPNFSTLRLQVVLTNSYQLDLSVSSINELLGFTSKIVTATEEGTNPVDITRGVNALMVRCDLISQSYTNDSVGDVLWTFVPTTSPGSAIDVNIPNRIYLPINRKDTISSIRMRITDQQNRPVDLNAEPVTYLLHIRRIR